MICPACRTEMFVLEFERIELDYCPECKGVWLDAGELELLAQIADAVPDKLQAALSGGAASGSSQGRKRRCPRCRKKLEEIVTAGEQPLTLDRCPAEHGIWFDQNELKTLIQAAGADPDNVVIRFFSRLESGQKSGEN